MKKLFLFVSVLLLIGFVSGCSKLGNPDVDETSPAVSSVTPSNGAANVAAGQAISITFSESMDESSVQEAFSISPSVSGDYSWSGNTMTFTPITLSYNTAYTCTVGTGAKDQAGNSLESSYVWGFTTIYSDDTGAPTVTSTFPAAGSVNIATLPTVCAAFNEDMNTTSAQSALSIDSIKPTGTFSWIGNTMCFSPSTALGSNATHTCTIGTGAKDMTGNPLASAESWDFTTGSASSTVPTVFLTSPANGANAVSVSSTILIVFSEGMNATSVNNAFLINGATPAGTTEWNGNAMTFTPSSHFANDTTYACTVGAGATSLAGTNMSEYDWSFKTIMAAPYVVSMSPSNGATDVPVSTSISVTFSQSMDTSSLIARINPSPSAGTLVWSDSDTKLTFTPATDLAQDTTYTLTLNVKNTGGIYLETNFTGSFTTGSE